MSRLGRIVIPDLPHHVTQRGNRRQPVFFESGDYALYRDILAERCHKAGVVVWAYCQMPNHVHLISWCRSRLMGSLVRSARLEASPNNRGEVRKIDFKPLQSRTNWIRALVVSCWLVIGL